jgi:hypothetical protein
MIGTDHPKRECALAPLRGIERDDSRSIELV